MATADSVSSRSTSKRRDMFKAQVVLLALAVAGGARAGHGGYGGYGGYGGGAFLGHGYGGLGGGAAAAAAYGPGLAPSHGHGGYSSGKSFAEFHGPVAGHVQQIKGTTLDKHGKHVEFVDYVAYPKYEFAYGVEDHHTGDKHGQKEHRDGDKVVGEYSLHEPGGVVRTVKYHADKHGGFFADVENHGHNEHVYVLKDAHGHGHHTVKASSYAHFHGPVAGHAQPIAVALPHHGY